MIKSIFILFFVASSANHIASVSGINCTEQNRSKHIDECIFECIQLIYDRQFCVSCKIGDRAKPVRLGVNDIFSSLAQYNNINYDVTSESIKVAECLECQNDYTGVSSKEKYVQTKELKQIFECAHMLTTQLDSSRGVCNLNEINRLYLEVGERFNKTHDWCYDELGINEHYQELKKMAEIAEKVPETNIEDLKQRSADVTADDTTEITDSISTSDSSVIIIDIENEATTEITTSPPVETTTQFEVFESNTHASTSAVSSTVPTSTIAKSNTTTKSKKKKPKAEAHHYPVSVAIIFTAIGILLVVLVISSIILSVYINRRKRIQARSDSCTYVFESREQ